eukprot:1729664-Rhodomonas_salina.3
MSSLATVAVSVTIQTEPLARSLTHTRDAKHNFLGQTARMQQSTRTSSQRDGDALSRRAKLGDLRERKDAEVAMRILQLRLALEDMDLRSVTSDDQQVHFIDLDATHDQHLRNRTEVLWMAIKVGSFPVGQSRELVSVSSQTPYSRSNPPYEPIQYFD